MISRYEVKEISQIWSEEARFKRLLEVEMALLKALEQKGKIPKGTSTHFENVKINPTRIREIEATTRHDVIAFCTSITEQVEEKHARYFHFGVTSSDILDTALSLQIRESVSWVVREIRLLMVELDRQAERTKDLLCLGRSHGMAAEPMVFAQKFLSARMEFKRRLETYSRIADDEMSGQISGSVGNYTVLEPEIEALTLGFLGLKVEPVSTQIIPRDRIAKIVGEGALIASAMERLATELRLLHHSDIGEVHEGFKEGQKGSSTMPHKKNPISSENVSGLARVIRSHQIIALENINLWHERDISHSSAERLFLPDHFGLLVYVLRRMSGTIRDLEVHRSVIEGKVEKNFSTLSSFILHVLIEENVVSREVLYPIVQSASFEAKSMDEYLSLIQQKVNEKGLKFNVARVNWANIRKTYFERFQTVMGRCKN